MDIFSKYNWTALSINNVVRYKTDVAGTYVEDTRSTKTYQLGIKFGGSSEIMYDTKKFIYSEDTIMYLPKEKRNNVAYNRTVIQPSTGISIYFNSAYPLHDKPELIRCGDISTIKELFIKLSNVYSHCYKEPDLECMSVLYKLLSKIKDYSVKSEIARIGKKRIEPSMKYIREHFCDTYIDLDYLAKLSGMTSEYFRHKFKELYGVSPLQYINQQKVNYAKRLLLNPSHTINQVSEFAGFADSNYFSRFFKQSTGITPTEYRKKYNDATMLW